MTAHPSVSIVLPTYNERDNIGWMIEQLMKGFAAYELEILVVDDHSPDGTGELVQTWSRTHPQVRLIVKDKKEGIGAALRVGYDAARGEIVASMDADRSFLVADVVGLVQGVEQGEDLVLGCRHMAGAAYEAHTRSIRVKRWVSRTGNIVLRRGFGLPIHDFSANCRAIRRSTWQRLHTTEKTNTLLMEMILRCYAGGFRVGERPVSFLNRRYGASKLRLSIEAPKFLLRMLLYRWRFSRLARPDPDGAQPAIRALSQSHPL